MLRDESPREEDVSPPVCLPALEDLPLPTPTTPSAKQSACIYDCHSQAAMSVTQSCFTPEPSSSAVHLSVHLLRCLSGLPFKLWIWMLAHHIDTQTTDTETHV